MNKVTVVDIQHKTFKKQLQGYDRSEVDAFLADRSESAYENVVDRLLDSPRYGEHMARFWLDAARYGDSHGIHVDNYREICPYRDWVIQAFNSNQPFDRFTIEQLAGDLLPHATPEQRIATGFCRNHRINTEGGIIAEEWHVETVIDRVYHIDRGYEKIEAKLAAVGAHIQRVQDATASLQAGGDE